MKPSDSVCASHIWTRFDPLVMLKLLHSFVFLQLLFLIIIETELLIF